MKPIAILEMFRSANGDVTVKFTGHKGFADMDPPDQVAVLLSVVAAAGNAADEIANDHIDEWEDELDEVYANAAAYEEKRALDNLFGADRNDEDFSH